MLKLPQFGFDGLSEKVDILIREGNNVNPLLDQRHKQW